jgi:hypothetical protein
MNVYVETNFILEFTFVQEQYEDCLKILNTGEAGSAGLVLPAFCLAESFESLGRTANRRRPAAQDLEPLLKNYPAPNLIKTKLTPWAASALYWQKALMKTSNAWQISIPPFLPSLQSFRWMYK